MSLIAPDAGSRVELVADWDMRTRSLEPMARAARQNSVIALLGAKNDDFFSLKFADFLLAKLSLLMAPIATGISDTPIKNLADILDKAGSEWRVGFRDQVAGLEKRLPEGVQIAVEETISNRAESGKLLAEAYLAAFGFDPNPEVAYAKAIKAVEQSAAEIVVPSDRFATLGKIANVMRDQGDWELLPLEADLDQGDFVQRMARVLWQGQPGRHGGNDYRVPTQGEAETAVMLAVPLVHWFESGSLMRR